MRVALLTPYSGCNLGDAAIQEAAAYAIHEQRPDATIIMLTADPANTQFLHGLSSFPMTGIFIPGYSNTIRVSNLARAAQATSDVGELRTWKSRIKRSSATMRVVGPPFRLVRAIFRFFWHLRNEIQHLIRAFRLARQLDVIIVSGGGQFDDYFGGAMAHPYTLAKWGWIARLAGRRYIALSVGVGQLASPLSRWLARAAVRSASYFSFRDMGSRHLLQFAKEAREFPVYPDLALGYPAHRIPTRCPRSASAPLRVGLAPIAYLSQHGWPEVNDDIFEHYYDCLLQFSQQLLARSLEVCIFYTDVPDDKIALRLAQTLQERRPEYSSLVSIRHCQTTADLLSTLSRLDVVVASRLHALILTHVFALPALAISYERKVLAHMSDMGQQDHCVDLHNLTLEEVSSKFDTLMRRRADVTIAVGRAVDVGRRLLAEQYLRVFAKSPAPAA